jgi:hypothetical protein
MLPGWRGLALPGPQVIIVVATREEEFASILITREEELDSILTHGPYLYHFYIPTMVMSEHCRRCKMKYILIIYIYFTY